ncbi:sulfurtransferase complex subunit TusD [Parendozoicomonas haliclonae]|uniref:Putative sulfurtransferase DsrE n=1 Tax=Parendozoicomonas haliclonae TaxID=1960125 RepID=A0A1X7AMC9_9GAMM|nr:sulfurtransferase complex subunit TusD [Parendozoicomonas haliclonae]SMA48978.1 putative sulfurtransferase DsrE [Parendozoicomonas haliclonae]
MKYTLIIHGSPAASPSSQTALRFARTALRQGHELVRIFFLGDGVYTASRIAVAPQGEQDLYQEWRNLGVEHGLDMVVCISAALKRGLLDEQEAQRYNQPAFTVEPPFTVSGLGQLVDGTVTADRTITFGA